MFRYNVRSRQLVDIVNDIKRKKLILSPYFQRNLVWRTVHKVDFIKTILMGYPFPEIFIAKGDLDIENMTSQECVVDGQQRLNSILEYIKGEFPVDNVYYQDLKEKEAFLKYEVAIIDLDIKHDDPQIKEVFKRLNRTYYSLSSIEKLASEYGASEIMLTAKLIAGEFKKIIDESENDNYLSIDPSIKNEFLKWAKIMPVKKLNELITESTIFSNYELSRKVHLMFSLNLIGTILQGIYTRNIDKELLDEYANSFEGKEEIITSLEKVATFILKMKFKKSSYWYNKANSFSLIYALYTEINNLDYLSANKLKLNLENFANDLPEEYRIAAKEGVNNKKERNTRHRYIIELIENSFK
ncbi:DUF262 domain-containing protein [Bacillus cereus]|uniref:DUF262 domain-containing protein n=1 Tax=Bacillus cereus TaxID=1396 RepID=UPI000BF6A421|nr:DUF262 domain-containing protein [Bacillus cereus]PFC35664.1 hypothetical protein CN310_22305 [Bacillus cereus]